ncbi:MAG TPA: hypothetical protein ENH43_02035 [Phycisphaerales bacterium]|nr:hypothetical protein [Phycisphaerales bacterium]
MLSFLRDQGPEDLSAQKPHKVVDSNSVEQTGKEKLNADGQQEYLTVSAQSKNVRRTTCLLAVLFGMGLLCLWFMVKKSTPQTASASPVNTEEIQIEMAITRLTGVRSEIFNRMERIVKKFYEFSDVQQVGVNELVKNPFKRGRFLGDLRESSDTRGKGLDKIGMMRQQQINNLELLSIMQSGQKDGEWCCMINDKILYEGDSIRGFKVRQISDSFVKLEWDPKADEQRSAAPIEGVEIILKLSE